jgi:pre-mRNA-splicing factor CDC5/CEF1
MPVVKGGVWTNIEDEILKASVSKYGLNQWARVSSLLARKTPKQCKARWSEWLDPGIRKIEWSKEEDEKLLHLAKLMPTQWRTIAPIVGRTATQCLERYQKLLDEAEARENDELGLGGPSGAETLAPSGDDVRKLRYARPHGQTLRILTPSRPGELDPDPESKPARPDTIDLDEDEKEMLSEARARLANTQGKKAKRKARERQLEESRRLATLQKRRELKNAGINTKIVTRKKGQMDYNADIPFEKQAIPGFYDTQEEQAINEHQREAFDPRRQQLARKRQGDPEDDPDRKRQKHDKNKPSAAFAAAAKAGQMQRIREAEQQSKRRALVLPSPQVSEGELEEIVKMGMAGDRAAKRAGEDEMDGSKGLVSNYNNMIGSTPIRTPRTPAQEDHITNEIRNIRALTETQSSLLGGENTPLHEGSASTGFDGIVPRHHQMITPNPMATPFRQGGANAVGTTPIGAGATPLRTPRDNLAINEAGGRQLIGQTPQEIKLVENSIRQQLRAKLSSLPKPKESDWELEELPSESAELNGYAEISEEDAAERDRRIDEVRKAAAAAEFRRQTQVYQRSLPRSTLLDLDDMRQRDESITDQIEAMIAAEIRAIIHNDARKFPIPGSKIIGSAPAVETFSGEELANARTLLDAEIDLADRRKFTEVFCSDVYAPATADGLLETSTLGTMAAEYAAAFAAVQDDILDVASRGNKQEKKLAQLHGGYQARSKALRAKIVGVNEALEKVCIEGSVYEGAQRREELALSERLERLREGVSLVSKREREAQDAFRKAREELRELEESVSTVNGFH